MKKLGDVSPLLEERNDELLAAFRRAAMSVDCLSLSDVVTRAVNSPCSRFWVSRKRAGLVVAAMLRGEVVNVCGEKREMYLEIKRRVAERLCDPMEKRTLGQIVRDVLCGGAPKFYLSESMARQVLDEMRRCRVLPRERR